MRGPAVSIIAKLFGISVPAWVIELVAVLALLGSAVLYLEHRGAVGELSKLQRSSVALVAKAQAAIVTEAKQYAADSATTQEKLNEALASNSDLQSQLAQRVRDFDAYRRQHANVSRPAGPTVAAGSGECGTESCGALASRLATVGDELAASVGELSASLYACERDRDALTGLPR
jgi:hypothetical protein